MDKLQRLNRWSSNTRRRNKGNVLILVGAITLGVIVAIILFALDYNQFLGASHQHLTACEAAGLAAAQDLSRIVVKDPNYGFIALTDFPPIGQGTIAADGRPVPVTGINTILGTARLDALIANQMNSPDLVTLANRDIQNANAAAQLLQQCLVNAVSQQNVKTGTTQAIAGADGSDPRQATSYTDMDGNVISPYDDSKKVYMSNLSTMTNGGKYVINSYNLVLGYLQSGGSTVTQIPNPDQQALHQVADNQRQGRFYKAFMDIPVTGAASGHFYFAGLSAQPALIDARQFVAPADYTTDPHLCSAVQVTAEHSFVKAENVSQQIFKSIACAEPCGTPDPAPAGVLTLSFPDGLAPGINTIADLLDGSKLSGPGNLGQATGGDWPYTTGSSLGAPSGSTGSTGSGGSTTTPTTSQMANSAVYSWMKSAHLKPSVQAMLDLKNTDLTGLLSSNSAASQTVSAKPNEPWWSPKHFDLMQPAYAQSANQAKNNGMIMTTIMSADPNVLAQRWNMLKNSDSQANNANAIKAYNAISSLTSVTTEVPDNSLKVLVDKSGNMWSADGSHQLTTQDIQKFWKAIAETVTAAYETEGVAKLILLTSPTNTNALNALANAQATVAAASKLMKQQSAYSEDGLTVNADGTFSLGNNLFVPHTVPATVANVITTNSPSGNSSVAGLSAQALTSWTAASKNFNTFNTSTAGGAATNVNQWRTALLEFDANGNVVASTVPSSPFAGLPVSQNQLIGISYDAFKNGSNMVWTAVYRDFSANLGQGDHAGQPAAGAPADWCIDSQFGFTSSEAASKGKGDQVMGIILASTGTGTGTSPTGNQGDNKGPNKDHKGCHDSGLQCNGSAPAGPGTANPGDGNINDDQVGFPWGYKYGSVNPDGASWTVCAAKYQFPQGNKEVGDSDICGNGKSFGPLVQALNAGTAGLTPNQGQSSVPKPETSTFVRSNGDALSVQPRSNYMCGGLVSSFDLRAPYINMQNSVSTGNGFGLQAGTGSIAIPGVSTPISIPNLKANITLGSSPASVIEPGDASLTPAVPTTPQTLD